MHLVPPLVGFGVLTTNLVEGLMCLWELQDNAGSVPHWFGLPTGDDPWKCVKTLKTMVVCEDIHNEDYDSRRHSREDYGVRRHNCFVVSFSSLLSHRNHRTVKWGPSEQSQSDWSDAQPDPMSSSEDNESKSYPESDKSALLVAQVKLPRVFEIWPLEHISVP